MHTLEIQNHIIEQVDDLILVNKPYAWPTSGQNLEDPDSVQYHLIKHYKQMVWAIHQLDADTSGICLFSLNKQLIKQVKSLWTQPETIKEYLVVVHGAPKSNHFESKQAIGFIRPGCLGGTDDGKAAHSSFELIDQHADFSLLRACLHSGRTHQIRIHLSELGHPLVGEEWYREPPCQRHKRQALHAYQIQFAQNNTLPRQCFRAPLAADLCQLIDSLGLRLPSVYTSDR